jgi:hypothetical protein
MAQSYTSSIPCSRSVRRRVPSPRAKVFVYREEPSVGHGQRQRDASASKSQKLLSGHPRPHIRAWSSRLLAIARIFLILRGQTKYRIRAVSTTTPRCSTRVPPTHSPLVGCRTMPSLASNFSNHNRATWQSLAEDVVPAGDGTIRKSSRYGSTRIPICLMARTIGCMSSVNQSGERPQPKGSATQR